MHLKATLFKGKQSQTKSTKKHVGIIAFYHIICGRKRDIVMVKEEEWETRKANKYAQGHHKS